MRTRCASLRSPVGAGRAARSAALRSVLFIPMAVVAMTGCGGSSQPGDQTSRGVTSNRTAAIGAGSKTLTCHSGGVFIGSGKPNWRQLSDVAGPFGLAHSAAHLGKRLNDGRFHTKDPVIVQGHRPVELWVPRKERDRVAIAVVDPDPRAGPWSRIAFVPCHSKPRTVWPAGLVLRDRSPIVLRVRVGDSVRTLRVRPIARRGRGSGPPSPTPRPVR